jgi:hypothetical protein
LIGYPRRLAFAPSVGFVRIPCAIIASLVDKEGYGSSAAPPASALWRMP